MQFRPAQGTGNARQNSGTPIFSDSRQGFAAMMDMATYTKLMLL